MILDKRLIIGDYPLFFERFGNTSNTTGTRVYVNSVSRVRIPPCPPYIAVYDDFINGLFLCRKCYYDTYYDIFIIKRYFIYCTVLIIWLWFKRIIFFNFHKYVIYFLCIYTKVTQWVIFFRISIDISLNEWYNIITENK